MQKDENISKSEQSFTRTIFAGIPPFYKAELQKTLAELGVPYVPYSVRGKPVADIIYANLRFGTAPLRGLPDGCLVQLGATSARNGKGFYPELDPVLLKSISDNCSARVILVSAPAETVISSILLHGDLAVRLAQADIPGLPADIGRDHNELLQWIDNYFSVIRSIFRDDPNFLELDVQNKETASIFARAFGKESIASIKVQQQKSSVCELLFSLAEETDNEFSLHLKEQSEIRSFDGKIGIKTEYGLKHCPLWRSFLTLSYASTTAAKMAGKHNRQIYLKTEFPLDKALVKLFSRRVEGYGHQLYVDSEIVDRRYNLSSHGSVLAFGGGKESRLAYGLLKEIGIKDLVACTTEGHPHDDIPELRKVQMFGTDNLEIRLLPGFMMLPANWYYGGSLGECARQTPWQYYYDYGSASERQHLSSAFSNMGYEVQLHSPTSVLTSNVCQRILCERYPKLAANQMSSPFDSKNEKTMLVALLYLYHGFSTDHVAHKSTIYEMINSYGIEFLSGNFGTNRVREPYRRESMAIIYYLYSTAQLPFEITFTPPESWLGRWINYIHSYVDQNIDTNIMSIYKEYAPIGRPAELDYVIPV